MSSDAEQPDQSETADKPEGHTVTIVGADGKPIGQVDVPVADGSEETNPADLVEQPAKVMRIGSMVKQLLEEVKAAPLDDAARERLASVHANSIKELADGLAPELREELERLTLPFVEGGAPSDAELRIAQAQLVGWLEGLFHGIQTALVAQQMAASVQLEQMRGGGRPPGQIGPPGQHPTGGHPTGQHSTGQYL